MTRGGADEALPPVVGAPAVPPERNPALAYLASLASPDSRATQRSALAMIARRVDPSLSGSGPADAVESFPWHGLRAVHTTAVAASLRQDEYEPATRRRMLCALRGVVFESWRLGHIDAEERERASDLQRVRGTSPPAGRALPPDEVRAVFAATAGADPNSLRTSAALALLFGGALRRSESVSITMDRLDPARRVVRVLGKGRKERVVPLGEWYDHIAAWVRVRGQEPGPLLCRLGRWERNRIQPEKGITSAQLYGVLQELGGKAGVTFAPHDARRTVITGLFKRRVDLRRIQEFAGHASPTTTAGYDRSEEDAMIDAVTGAGRVSIGG